MRVREHEGACGVAKIDDDDVAIEIAVNAFFNGPECYRFSGQLSDRNFWYRYSMREHSQHRAFLSQRAYISLVSSFAKSVVSMSVIGTIDEILSVIKRFVNFSDFWKSEELPMHKQNHLLALHWTRLVLFLTARHSGLPRCLETRCDCLLRLPITDGAIVSNTDVVISRN